MLENRYIINYDIKSKLVNNITFKEGDVNSSVIQVNLINDSLAVDITGEVIEFRFLKSDNTIVFQDITTGVTVIDALNGKVECVLMANTLACIGKVDCEIFRSKDGKSLTTPTFSFKVEDSIGGEGVLSSNYISKIENKLTEWQNTINNYIANASNQIVTFDNWVEGQTVVIVDGSQPDIITPPSNVINLQYTNATSTGLKLTWTASTSPDIAYYNIYRGSVKIGNTTNTTFNVTGLITNTEYSLTVKAVDTSENEASGITITAQTTKIIVSDTFNRSDNTSLGTAETGQVWSTIVGESVIANSKATGGSTDNLDIVVIETAKADVTISMDVFGITTVDRTLWISARQIDATNYLMLEISYNNLKLLKWNNGIKTTLNAGVTIPYVDGKTVAIKLNGSTIEGLYDGIKYIDYVEEDFKTITKHGIGFWDSRSILTVDNFKIELP